MTRLSALVLLCLACGANSPELVDSGDDDDDQGGSSGAQTTGGEAGTGMATGGAAGVGGAPQGGVSGAGAPSGGSFPTGGAFPNGGTSTGGVFPTGGSSTGGTTVTGGTGPTGGAAPTGGTSGASAGGAAGAGGRLLWSREFTYTGTTVYGTTGRYELKIVRAWPNDVCLRIDGGDVPHGMVSTTTLGLGETLRTCLSAVPQTSPSRHTFDVTAPGTGLIGGSTFELPEESRMWLARSVVRRITQNDWSPGAVTVRVTWEFRE